MSEYLSLLVVAAFVWWLLRQVDRCRKDVAAVREALRAVQKSALDLQAETETLRREVARVDELATSMVRSTQATFALMQQFERVALRMKLKLDEWEQTY